jgi:archaeosine-15-forming tRNA-guanine transglycosylase
LWQKSQQLATLRIHFGITSACGRGRQIIAHPSHFVRQGKLIFMKFILKLPDVIRIAGKREVKGPAGSCQTLRVDGY